MSVQCFKKGEMGLKGETDLDSGSSILSYIELVI